MLWNAEVNVCTDRISCPRYAPILVTSIAALGIDVCRNGIGNFIWKSRDLVNTLLKMIPKKTLTAICSQLIAGFYGYERHFSHLKILYTAGTTNEEGASFSFFYNNKRAIKTSSSSKASKIIRWISSDGDSLPYLFKRSSLS